MPQNWFDVGNAIMGAGTGLIGGIDKMQKEKQAQKLGLLQSGYTQDEKGDFAKSPELLKREATAQQHSDLENQKLKKELTEGKPPTEAQGKMANFANRMANAESDIKRVEDSGYDPAAFGNKARGMLSSVVGDWVKSDPQKMYDQAQENFASASLRPESGAVISNQERSAEKAKYFPSANDSPEVRAQKARARAAQRMGFEAQAGSRAMAAIPKQGMLPPLSKQGGGLLGGGQTAMANQPPVVHTKQSLGALSDDELLKLSGK